MRESNVFDHVVRMLAGLAVLMTAGCGRFGFAYLETDAAVGEPPPADDELDGGEPDASASDAAELDDGQASEPDGSETDAGDFDGGAAEAGEPDAGSLADTGTPECHLSFGGAAVGYRGGEAAALEGTYILALEQTGLCAAPAGCSAALGAEVVQTPCDRSACQMWEAFEGNGSYALRNVANGACLYMTDTADGTRAITWECFATPREQWRALCAVNETWRLISTLSSKPLRGDGQSTPGAGIDQGPEADSAQQRWNLSSRTMAITSVLPSSEGDAGQTWRYTTTAPAVSWIQATFDDSAWSTGAGGFGDTDRGYTPARTPWTQAELWLRRSFQLTSLPASLSVRVFHDEDAEVYINGVLAFSEASWSQGYRTVAVPSAVSSTLQIGSNSIAVHCRSTSTPQFLDVGVAVVDWR
jgi:Ricin-type beta-trefoil lectin domain-like